MDTHRIMSLLPQGHKPLARGDIRALGVPECVIDRVGWPDVPVDPAPFVEEIENLLHDWSLADSDLMESLRRRGAPRGELLTELKALEDAFFPPVEGTKKSWVVLATQVAGTIARNLASLAGGILYGLLQGILEAFALFERDASDDDDDPPKKGRRR